MKGDFAEDEKLKVNTSRLTSVNILSHVNNAVSRDTYRTDRLLPSADQIQLLFHSIHTEIHASRIPRQPTVSCATTYAVKAAWKFKLFNF
jgi:hypothetical protein